MTPTPMDYTRLLQRMKESSMTRTGLAKTVGIDPGRMMLKLNNRTCFKLKEIENICKVLEIPAAEISAYFYTPKGDEEIPGREQPNVGGNRDKVADYTMELLKPEACSRATRAVRAMEVIEVRTMAGSGTRDDPTREQVTYWTLDGELLGYGI